MKTFFSALALGLLLYSCQPNTEQTGTNTPDPEPAEIYPAAEGFNTTDSDSAALAIADSVMVAMGGWEAYNELRYLDWVFFGNRHLIWDKLENRVRIEDPRSGDIYLLNIDEMTGAAKIGGSVIEGDSLTQYLDRAKAIWINDSYWLVMPFKLKDSGVTLKYVREDTLPSNKIAHVLQLTFEGVGVTPDNKYEIYVDQSDYLVKQWAYFKSYEQDSASAIWPWDNYKEYNGVLLSADRSDNGGPGNLEAYVSAPDDLFTQIELTDN